MDGTTQDTQRSRRSRRFRRQEFRFSECPARVWCNGGRLARFWAARGEGRAIEPVRTIEPEGKGAVRI
jgi:hypothetical protein